MPVYFHSEPISFKPDNDQQLADWIINYVSSEGYQTGDINYIFCDDEYLLQINQQYLNHDYYTDIITFDYSDDAISGDLFISIDRVKENATKMALDWQEELHRVMIHGVLHLLGYQDKTKAEQKNMRTLENQALRLIKQANVPRGTSNNT